MRRLTAYWGEDRTRGMKAVLIALLCVLYIGIRCIGINHVVTTDEPLWLGRSANFYRALSSGQLSFTYQMAQPGVMTMWAGSLAYFIFAHSYAAVWDYNLPYPDDIKQLLEAYNFDPLKLMVAAKVCKILLQAGFFAFAISTLWRIAGAQIALLTGLLIVFDPFLSGLDSALHVDGLFSICCFAALMAMVYAALNTNLHEFSGKDFRWWIISAVISGCAVLTRAPGVVLVGVAGLALLLPLVVAIRDDRSSRRRYVMEALSRYVVWILSIFVAIYLLLPALWVQPWGVLGELWSWSEGAASGDYSLPSFFRGKIYPNDPGMLYYPFVLLWRSTPVEWLGVLLLLIALPIVWRQRLLSREIAWLLIVPLGFAVAFTIGMSIGGKKYDRYVLPDFPVITLFAAIGIACAIDVIARRWPRVSLNSALAVVTVVVLIQGLMTQSALPYRLDFYNPLLGGTSAAASELPLGWGEGGYDVVKWISGENPPDALVNMQSKDRPGIYSYFLEDFPNVSVRGFGLNTPADWFNTNYYVASIQQTQRNLSKVANYFAPYDPVHTVNIEGVPYFQIYEPKKLPLPDELRNQTSCNAVFGNQLQLMDIVGQSTVVDLYWMSTAQSPHKMTVTVQFVAPDGTTYSSYANWTPAKAIGVMSRARVKLPDLGNIPLKKYDLIITVNGAKSGKILNFTLPWNALSGQHFSTAPRCYYTQPKYTPQR